MDTIEQYINANYIKVRALHISQPFSRERIKPFFWNE
jgi:hypothetical protein